MDSFSKFSPSYIEELPFVMQFKVRRKFFTFDCYGEILNNSNSELFCHFKLNNTGYIFTGLKFSGKLICTDHWNFPGTCPCTLMNQFEEECLVTTPYKCNEMREHKFVMRELFHIDTQKMNYKLWCTTELYWFSENPQRLLVLSDEQDTIIMRGRTESCHKRIEIINCNDEVSMLIPVFFYYIMHPPFPC